MVNPGILDPKEFLDTVLKMRFSNPFMPDTVRSYVAGIRPGDAVDTKRLAPVLYDAKIFGVDLYEVGLEEKVRRHFAEMCAGKHAVREDLQRL